MDFVALVIIQLLVLAQAVSLTDVYPTYKSEACSFFTNLNTSAVTTLDDAFRDSNLVCDGEPWHWDVTEVTTMRNTFFSASAFNSDIGSWDVTKVTSMYWAFFGATAFNSDIGSWDVTNVTTMYGTFYGATAFNSDIGSWDVTKVTDMYCTFFNADAFNSDIGSWDVTKVTDMDRTFDDAFAFNSDIGSWDVTKVTTMYRTFDDATAFNGDLRSWCVTAVTDHTDFCVNSAGCIEPIWGTCPTGAPTTPTFSPTGAPTTGAPTTTPTFSPTGAPTTTPTLSPTGAPTTTPTLSPTGHPTGTPTGLPTGTPTAPTSSPSSTTSTTVIAPASVTVSDSDQVLRSVPFEGPFLVPNSTIIAIPGQHHPPDAFVPVSPVISIVLTLDGAEVPVTSLQEPIVFVLNITTNITDLTHTTCVADGQTATSAVLPECVFWNSSQDVWSAAGCKVSNVTPTTVTCHCLHLTEFSIGLPSFNELEQTEVRGLADLSKYPTTGIVLLCVLVAFGMASIVGSRVDHHKDSVEKQEAKRKKWHWERQQGRTPDFVRSLKAKFQHSHPWFAVCFRQSGSSFLSVDRCLVLLVLVLCNMATTAAFWARPGDELLVRVALSSAISFSTYEILEQLFKRCGTMGFREEWEREQLATSANACQRCLQSRFPEYVRLILRLVCFSLVCFLSIIVLLYGVKFDLGPSFFCNNANGARSWLLTFLVVTLGDILVSRPIKLVLWHGLKFYIQKTRQKPAATELKDLDTHAM